MKKNYLVRVTMLEPIGDDLNELARKIALAGLKVHHAEIFDESDFVKDVWKGARLNEIDIDFLFQDILHISEEEIVRYLFGSEKA